MKALRESEEKLENDKLKTEFFGDFSHDFKTPLNVLMGSIQLIELYTINRVVQDPEKKLDKYIKTMKQNTYRLLKLINNVIDLTKIDSNYYDINFHNYDIACIIEDIINSIKIYAELKLVEVTFINKIGSKIIACDADKIERILLNLISNALKFTPENGNIIVRLWTDSDYICISIEDDGIGIQEDKFDSIFQRFKR